MVCYVKRCEVCALILTGNFQHHKALLSPVCSFAMCGRMEGMTFALHLGDVTCKELNLSEGLAAVIVDSTQHKNRLDG